VSRYTEFRLRGETFRAHTAMPLKHVRRLARAQEPVVPYSMIAAAIRATLVDEDRRRWDALLADESVDPPIALKTLSRIAVDLMRDPWRAALRR
jgi:hypothetical protein